MLEEYNKKKNRTKAEQTKTTTDDITPRVGRGDNSSSETKKTSRISLKMTDDEWSKINEAFMKSVAKNKNSFIVKLLMTAID